METTKRGRGAPTRLTAAVLDRAAARVANGWSAAKAARAEELHPETLRRALHARGWRGDSHHARTERVSVWLPSELVTEAHRRAASAGVGVSRAVALALASVWLTKNAIS